MLRLVDKNLARHFASFFAVDRLNSVRGPSHVLGGYNIL